MNILKNSILIIILTTLSSCSREIDCTENLIIIKPIILSIYEDLNLPTSRTEYVEVLNKNIIEINDMHRRALHCGASYDERIESEAAPRIQWRAISEAMSRLGITHEMQEEVSKRNWDIKQSTDLKKLRKALAANGIIFDENI